MSRTLLRAVLVVFVSVPFQAAPASAQAWERFAVADSALGGALAGARAEYENAWNALFVAELRASLARADSAARLGDLERRVARAEPGALGSHIARDALALRGRWTQSQRRLRVSAAATESLATAARTARAWPAADSLYRESLAAYRRLGEKRREAWVLGSLGAVALSSGRDDRALEVYADALAARRALGDPRLLGNTLNDLGQTCLRLERYEESARYLGEAAAVREASGQWPGLGASLGNLGTVMVALGDRDSAERCFTRSLALLSAAGDSARILTVLVNYGSVLMERGEVERPLAIYDRALAIARQGEDAERTSVLEDNLGDLERRRGRFTVALRHQQAAVALRGDDPPRLAYSLSALGRTLTEMGDPDRGRPPLERAQAIADSLGDPALASRTAINLAFNANAAGDLDRARMLVRQALDRAFAAGDSALVCYASHTAGQIELGAGNPGGAGPWIDRALAANPHASAEEKAGMLVNRALAWHLAGRLDEAETVYRRALAIAVDAGASDLAARILTNLGDVCERRGDDACAFARYGEALALIDTMRANQSDREAVKTLANRVFVHEAMIHLLGRLDREHPDSGYAARAFDWAERARARALLDLVAAAGGQAGAAPTVTLPEAQRRLGEKEALLEYSVGDSSSSLWVIRRDRWRLLHLPARAALRLKAQRLRQGLGDPAEADAERTLLAARALYRELIEPAEPWLGGIERLVVSPDGPLARIPFEALLARDPAQGKVPKGAFLIERFPVRYAVSASSLALEGGPRTAAGIVAAGNPEFASGARDSGGPTVPEGEGLAALPNTALELDCLRRLAGGRRVTMLAGADASAGRVLALPALPTAELIHFATHGDVNESEPERSGLWFAPDSGAAGPSRLEVARVLELRLAADLVTLSACETGLGRLERGEGVIGLPRAFLAAGARSVLVSLWSVNDRSTAMLMESFYRRALKDGKDRAIALREAKRDLIARSETRSPFYWAPFVLMGDPGGGKRR